MNIFKRISAMALGIFFIASLPSFAENEFVSAQNTGSNVVIAGKVSGEVKKAIIAIFAYGSDENNYKEEAGSLGEAPAELSSIIYFGVTDVSEDGTVSDKAVMPEGATVGDYKVYLRAGDAEYTSVLRFIPEETKLSSIKAINSALDVGADAFLSAVSDNEYSLSVFMDYTSTKETYDSVKNKSSFFEAIKKMGKYSEKIDDINDTVKSFNNNLDKTILLCNIENNKDDIKQYILDYKEKLGIETDAINEKNSDYIYEKIAALSDITSADEVNKCILDNGILYDIVHSGTWGALKSVIEKNADYLEIDISDTTVDYGKVYHTLFDERETFETLEEIVSRFNELKNKFKKTAGNTPGGSSPGGSGGSGSSGKPKPTYSGGGSGTVTTPGVAQENTNTGIPFKDVSKDFWGYDKIKSLYDRKIISGKAENAFAPQDNITREEFTALIVRAMGIPKEDAEINFSDVNAGDWYYDSVLSAGSAGIISGMGNNSFGVGRNITREDIAVIISRCIKYKNISAEFPLDSGFNDNESIAEYAKQSVSEIKNLKLISGYPDGTFRPKNKATRAEAASMIYSLLELIGG